MRKSFKMKLYAGQEKEYEKRYDKILNNFEILKKAENHILSATPLIPNNTDTE